MVLRETFKKIYTNAEVAAGANACFEDLTNAERDGNIPHNALIASNQSTSVTVYIYLDIFKDDESPDYILFPQQQLNVPVEDGKHFTHVFIKNTHGANALAADEFKLITSTVKEV